MVFRLFASPANCAVLALLIGLSITAGRVLQNEAFSGDPAKQSTWGKPVDGVLAGIELVGRKDANTPLERSALEPVLIKCHTKNQGSRAIKLIRRSILFVYRFVIIGPNGKEVPLTEYGKHQEKIAGMGSTSIVELEPGGTATGEIHLSRIYDMTEAGEYRISFSRIFWFPKGPNQTVTSNVLTVKIRNPE